MGRIAGTCYFKVGSDQLSLTGGIEVPFNTATRDDVMGLDGSADFKETFRAPYAKGTFKVPSSFPIDTLVNSTDMTITVEFANKMVYVLREAWLSGEGNFNAEEGTADLEFHGTSGFFQ